MSSDLYVIAKDVLNKMTRQKMNMDQLMQVL